MPLTPDAAVQTSLLGIPLIPLLKDVLFGALGLIAVLFFHGGWINYIILRFERITNQNLKLKQYNRVFFHFYAAFFFIAVIHIIEIVLWTIYLLKLNLVEDAVKSLIFAGSCYTTIGFVDDILPIGWKSLAFFISFSGLFCMAWTTSVMIGMTNAYKSAWNLKHHQKDLSASS
ncbi:hypothetical protein [Polynucleobacter sp. MWH-Braz-FAM2G]|uniref:hypothetical protein n=1 Tax=Polynucleobacter sp. MWH-Braz-FAM2G TaxID=1855883 RepID=UPI001BFCD619|nr:hypothetical protein [Polynucleobacter sp. MWH-Braz-FAM2G]QWD91478.1 hypothetical protein FD973_03870 [Polynucleobacter sp. MWH-Braz-FAM2G]